MTGKLFHLLSEPIYCKTWEEREEIGIEPVLQLTGVAKYVLHERLKNSIKAMRKERFEDFAFDWVCSTEGRLPEIQYDDGLKITASAYQRIATLRDSEQLFYRPASENFPMVDFATSCIKWFNAKSKSTKSSGNTIDVGVDGARKFLRELEDCIEKKGMSIDLKELVRRDAPTLVILKNRDSVVKLSTEEDLMFFDEKVEIKEIDLSDTDDKTGKSREDWFKLLRYNTRTEELLKDLKRQKGTPSSWAGSSRRAKF